MPIRMARRLLDESFCFNPRGSIVVYLMGYSHRANDCKHGVARRRDSIAVPYQRELLAHRGTGVLSGLLWFLARRRFEGGEIKGFYSPPPRNGPPIRIQQLPPSTIRANNNKSHLSQLPPLIPPGQQQVPNSLPCCLAALLGCLTSTLSVTNRLGPTYIALRS
ncbi:hypothetical protein BGZ61DRAFT_438328 [Ilyonectria robusta]|uniref:uncharacterized protein n=1 Tax=Ilyonectria robusta TaxID=1079257 RepID=UPI001E8CB20B|nr:uncharacterized protein BGZ61DRAFT_438328 [Ilyonectria robusta]KAH8737445.1 hypothetical protein BGZ61DRAFT_438328 [Ilyonectria robusta]